MYGELVHIDSDLDGWSARIRARRIDLGDLLGIGLYLIGGLAFGLGGLFGAWQFLFVEPLGVLFCLPFVAIGGGIVAWPLWAIYAAAHVTRIEISRRSVRLERCLLGVPFQRAEMRLQDLGEVWLEEAWWSATLVIGSMRAPVPRSDSVDGIVTWLQQGRDVAAAEPDRVPAIPAALQALRE